MHHAGITDALSVMPFLFLKHSAAPDEIRTILPACANQQEACCQRLGLMDFADHSLGMNGDYAEANHEGSTIVRVGTVIFGERENA